MYLNALDIKNFRVVKELNLNFNKGLNILIGENNSGKSAIIDALRICIGYGNLDRDIYVRRSDFYIDKANPAQPTPQIEFHMTFKIERPEEAGIFNELLVQKEFHQELQLHFIYRLEEIRGLEKIRWQVWGGANEGEQVSPEILNMLYYVYLAPLRDAERFLRPGRGNRLGELYATLSRDAVGNIVDDDKRIQMTRQLNDKLSEDDDWRNLINGGQTKIKEHIGKTFITGKEPDVDISFLPFEFRKIVDSLRIQFPVYDSTSLGGDKSRQRYLEIFQNGLGYNNLIYTATILGDLNNRRELDPNSYMALLIEEPEAHLHPQLQNIFFNYLSDLQTGFQIFVTSHSPTLTAKAKLDHTIVLSFRNGNINSLSLSQSSLDENNRNYLSKFLDVTKSQLFFANGIILVEGISEALLLPVFARMIGKNEEDYDLTKHGIEIVNINGVAFEHFAKLFNADDPNIRLNIPCSIITDDDRISESEEISSRALKAQELESGLVKVELAEKTFEYALFKTSEQNQKIMMDIFKDIHPVAANRVKGSSVDEYADSFLKKVANNKAKSELAHRLSLKLEEDKGLRSKFTVPDYIARAIRWAVKRETGENYV